MKILMDKIQSANKTNYINLYEKLNQIKNFEFKEDNLIDLNSDSNIKIRMDNIKDTLYNLQMKQFAESICSIKTDTDVYIIGFDPSEKIDQIIISKSDYQNLINYRDPLNSVCVYDLFQEKIHSYHGSSTCKLDTSKKSKEKVQVGKKVNINYYYCHHCKQRKPRDFMLQCKSFKTSKCKEHIKVCNVNGTTVVRRNL